MSPDLEAPREGAAPETPRSSWEDYYARGEGPGQDAWLDVHRDRLGLGGLDRAVDLGCGAGANLPILGEVAREVWACDYAASAIARVRTDFPRVHTTVADFREGLPYATGLFDLAVADLSFHYFEAETTTFLVAEAARILVPRGLLLCRVNSLADVAHGAGRGTAVEEHLYRSEAGLKRFFDAADVDRFFLPSFEVLAKAEARSGKYRAEKALWDLVLKARWPMPSPNVPYSGRLP